MKFMIIFGLVLFGFVFTILNDDLAFAQFSNQPTLKISFENNVSPPSEHPLPAGKPFTLIQSHSWVHDETTRYNIVSYTLDGETTKISRAARGDLTISIPTDSSHEIVFSAVPQHALSVEGTLDYAYLPTSPTQDNWFDKGTTVSVNVVKTLEVEPNKVRQQITGWSLDKAEFWEIEDDGMASFTTPPITMNEYHQVDFFGTYQYKVNVVSDSGTTFGTGWYELGENVPIGVRLEGDGLILNTVSNWEWSEGADLVRDGNNLLAIINGPVTATAKVDQNYSLVVAVIAIPVIAGGVIYVKKFKKNPILIPQTVEAVEETPKKKYSDKYDEELSEFLADQILEKLNEMKSSKIIPEKKFLKISETQKFVKENIGKNLK